MLVGQIVSSKLVVDLCSVIHHVNIARDNQVMYDAIPLENVPAVDRIQNMTFDLLGAAIGKIHFNAFLV